ncbi:unnamed protein product [Strongylus vulgaris]|uniref:Glycoside hydrolase family 31 N-terminal domain-containing protein n=1 Tax=Strongylus vulgaris TaxID=40348 RepID=A0A3P7LS83_STRVU|nr:unnamed protein product [Strongylus vulgaris]
MRSIQDLYPMAKNTKIMLGVVWPDRHVAFPDFFDISSNTPANFGTNQGHPWYFDSPDHPDDAALMCPMVEGGKDAEWDMPPYKTHSVYYYGQGTYLASKTLCMLAVQANGTQRFYNLKNLYGWSEAKATQQAMHKATGKRGAVISRSTFPSSGRFAGHWLGDNTATWADLQSAVIGAQEFNMFGIPYIGSDICGFNGETNEELCLRWQQMGAFHPFMSGRFAGHWLGDNTATWADLQSAVTGAQEFNMFGIPYIGSDICGFNGETNEELCLRWQQMGAFHPFMRNHNTEGASPQDPAQWPSVTAAAIKANLFRYSYLPYLFSLHFVASMNGGTVVRPLFYEYPKDQETYNLGQQFLWGSSMLVAPVLYQRWVRVKYTEYTSNYGQPFNHGYQTLNAPTTSLIPVFVRGRKEVQRRGSILPRQKPNVTTAYTRNNAFELLIAPGSKFSKNSFSIETENKKYI